MKTRNRDGKRVIEIVINEEKEMVKVRLRLTCKWILHWISEKEFKSSISLSSTSKQ